MRNKAARHREILRLVRQRSIETQEELAAALADDGHTVSQPTLSRDLAELRLSKVAGPDGSHRYQIPGELTPHQRGHRLHLALTQFLTSWELAGQLLVLKTAAGHAAGVAWGLDSADWAEIVGTLAGEDTVLVVSRTPGDAAVVKQRLERLIGR